jgi:hypothetical protein
MATFYLINAVFIGGAKRMPGTLIDDAVVDTAALISAGGELVPSAAPGMSAASAKAIAAHVQRGANEAECEGIMRSALEASQTASFERKETQTIPGAALPAKGVNVHAQFAAGAAINATTAFTLPYPRRALEVVLGAAAVATVFTVKGTRVDGVAFTLTKSVAGTGTFEIGDGAQCPETITSFSSDVDPGDTVDLKTADGFSVGEPFVGTPTVSVDGVVEAAPTLNATWGGVKSGTNPNGTHAYSVRYATAT